MQPPFSPIEAKSLGEGNHNGIIIDLDGPMNSPAEIWSPFVTMPDGSVYAVSGEIGDPITAESKWIKCPD